MKKLLSAFVLFAAFLTGETVSAEENPPKAAYFYTIYETTLMEKPASPELDQELLHEINNNSAVSVLKKHEHRISSGCGMLSLMPAYSGFMRFITHVYFPDNYSKVGGELYPEFGSPTELGVWMQLDAENACKILSSGKYEYSLKEHFCFWRFLGMTNSGTDSGEFPIIDITEQKREGDTVAGDTLNYVGGFNNKLLFRQVSKVELPAKYKKPEFVTLIRMEVNRDIVLPLLNLTAGNPADITAVYPVLISKHKNDLLIAGSWLLPVNGQEVKFNQHTMSLPASWNFEGKAEMAYRSFGIEACAIGDDAFPWIGIDWREQQLIKWTEYQHPKNKIKMPVIRDIEFCIPVPILPGKTLLMGMVDDQPAMNGKMQLIFVQFPEAPENTKK